MNFLNFTQFMVKLQISTFCHENEECEGAVSKVHQLFLAGIKVLIQNPNNSSFILAIEFPFNFEGLFLGFNRSDLFFHRK